MFHFLKTLFFPQCQIDHQDDDFSMCVFPEHKEFIQICRDAELEARRTGQKTNYWWRGYRGVIGANLPPMTVPGLELRLMHALDKIPDKTIPETLVKKNTIIFSTYKYIYIYLLS